MDADDIVRRLMARVAAMPHSTEERRLMYEAAADIRQLQSDLAAAREERDTLRALGDRLAQEDDAYRRIRSERDSLRTKLARWRDPDSAERQALQEEIILALGDGSRSEIELREGQLAQAEAALELTRAELERTKADAEALASRMEQCASDIENSAGMNSIPFAEMIRAALAQATAAGEGAR